jgi:hypothetical protein
MGMGTGNERWMDLRCAVWGDDGNGPARVEVLGEADRMIRWVRCIVDGRMRVRGSGAAEERRSKGTTEHGKRRSSMELSKGVWVVRDQGKEEGVTSHDEASPEHRCAS